MALPLVLAGLGVLGGGQYLINKADQRQAQNKRTMLQTVLQDMPLAQANPGWAEQQLQQMDQFLDGGNLINPQASERAGELLQRAQMQNQQYIVNERAERALQMGQAKADRTYQMQQEQQQLTNQLNIGNDIQADIRDAEMRFKNLEQGARRVIPVLDDPNMSNMQAYEATLAMLQALLPGEAIMEGDIQAAVAGS
jgi:putative protein kinase ArgK-like GTPase of G3E family